MVELKPEVQRVESEIDKLLRDYPEELKKVRENRTFLKKASEMPIPKEKAEVKVFGVKNINLNAILKKNIENRSIFTVDHLCKMHYEMTLAQMLKNRKKKRPMPFNLIWLVILIIGVPAAIIILLVLFGGI